MSRSSSPITYNEYISEESRLFDTSNLRVDAPNSPTSDYDNATSNVNSPLETKPPSPPGLTRDLNTHQWSTGYDIFTVLHAKYITWKMFVYVFPFYVISISVSTIQYFTPFEFYWFCLILPFAGALVLDYIVEKIMFTEIPSVSRDTLSRYPGTDYEYGSLIYTHRMVGTPPHYIPEYQYWIVLNPTTKCIEFISVYFNDYNGYNKHTVTIM